MKDSTFNINVRFVGTYDERYGLDTIEMHHALYNTILNYCGAGEIKILGGMEGININIQVQPLEKGGR